MILLLFFVFVPAARLITFWYRKSRLMSLKRIYDDYISGKPLKSKSGKPISFLLYRAEIVALMELCNVEDYCFSEQINHATVAKTIHAFDKAIGIVNYQYKISEFPNTYFKILANLPYAISRKVGITPSKSLALVLYILYIGFGCLDLSTAIYKLIEIIA